VSRATESQLAHLRSQTQKHLAKRRPLLSCSVSEITALPGLGKSGAKAEAEGKGEKRERERERQRETDLTKKTFHLQS
jgi:hypothetical protein